MNLKAGVLTSEFWVAVVPFILVAVKQFSGIEFEQDEIVNLVLALAGVVQGITYIKGTWGMPRLWKAKKDVIPAKSFGELDKKL